MSIPIEKTPPPLRVLVVDDNRDAADSMALLLDVLGHPAKAAYSAGEALSLASDFVPDAVLLDLELPDGDGFSVLGRLRALPVPPTFVAALTGHAGAEHRQRTLAAGFDAHLEKPIDLDGLERGLARAMTLRR